MYNNILLYSNRNLTHLRIILCSKLIPGNIYMSTSIAAGVDDFPSLIFNDSNSNVKFLTIHILVCLLFCDHIIHYW